MSQSVFAHANGFPSATYAKLFEALAPEYRVDHLEMHGHDPRFPVNDNWDNLVDELLHHLASLEQPVWGVGHSLGGVLHYHAALRRPELYRGVVMLDSPVLTLADRLVIRAAKRFGFIDRITPAGRTLGRREAFPDLEEARAYFSGKALFRRFDPDCLEAYVRHGLADSGGGSGLRLRFDPATEISIYRSVPHSSPGRPRQLQVPLAMVRGRHSSSGVAAPHPADPGDAARRVHVAARRPHVPAGAPAETAELLKGVFDRWSRATEERSA